MDCIFSSNDLSCYNTVCSSLNVLGHVDLWHALRTDESVRIRLLSEPGMFTSNLMTDKLVFLLCQHFQYLPAFYKASNFFMPINHTTQVIHIGRSSLHYSHRNKATGSGDLLNQNRAQIVLACKETRKAVPFPDSIVKSIKSNLTSDVPAPVEPFEVLTKPRTGNGVEQGTVRVQPSDMDYYMHTNHASYARFCLDVGSWVAANGKLTGFSKDLAFYKVKDFKSLYQGETSAGDLLTVTMWEDGERTLKFIVEEKDISVFQCVMEFYADEEMRAKL